MGRRQPRVKVPARCTREHYLHARLDGKGGEEDDTDFPPTSHSSFFPFFV